MRSIWTTFIPQYTFYQHGGVGVYWNTVPMYPFDIYTIVPMDLFNIYTIFLYDTLGMPQAPYSSLNNFF